MFSVNSVFRFLLHAGLYPLTEILHHMKIENEITLEVLITLLKYLNAKISDDYSRNRSKNNNENENGNGVNIDEKKNKKEKNHEIIPMSALVDRFLNYESRDTDDMSSKNGDKNFKILKKDDLFNEFLEFKKDSIERNESSVLKNKNNTKNNRSVKDFEKIFSATNGVNLDSSSSVDKMTYESPSVSAGDVTEVEVEVDVEVDEEEAEVIAAYRHAASIKYTPSSDNENENSNSIGMKNGNENERVKAMKGRQDRKDETPVQYFDVNFTDNRSRRSADRPSPSPSTTSIVTGAVVHYHVASPHRSPSSSSPSSPKEYAHHKNTPFNSTTVEQSVYDKNTEDRKVGLIDETEETSALSPLEHEILKSNNINDISNKKELNSFLTENDELKSNTNCKAFNETEILDEKSEEKNALASDADKEKRELNGIDFLNEEEVNDEDINKNENGRESDKNELHSLEKIIKNFNIDEKFINFDNEKKELDAEIRDFDDNNPLEALLNLHERHLLQGKLHAKQQGNIKNQQLDLLQLKKVVAIKLMEKEKENEELKILRNELLLKNQIKMEMPSNFELSNLSELKIPLVSVSNNSSELDGISEMKELSSLTTPNQNFYKYKNNNNNNNNNNFDNNNSINRKFSKSGDAYNKDNNNTNKVNDKMNNYFNDSRMNRSNSSDYLKQKETKSYKYNNKNYKNKNIQEDILDDPYEKIPYIPKESSIRVERSLEFLSPKERSIRKSQIKKSEAERALMTLEKAKNAPQHQHQDIPIADHIKVIMLIH